MSKDPVNDSTDKFPFNINDQKTRKIAQHKFGFHYFLKIVFLHSMKLVCTEDPY